MSRVTSLEKLGGLVAAVAILALVLACQPQPAGVMSPEEATAFMQRMLPIPNEGNLDLINELYAPDFVRHVVDVRDDIVGTEALAEVIKENRTAFPDYRLTEHEVLVAGDTLITTWTSSGTFENEFMGEPPTGKSFSNSGVTLSKIADGKIVEEWVYYNALKPWQDVGYTLVPATPEEDT